GIAVGVAAAAAAFPVWQSSALLAGRVAALDGQVHLAHVGSASAVYDRATQTMMLLDDERLVDTAGPDCTAAPLAAAIVRAQAAGGDRVLVIGQGTGRLPRLLLQVGLHEVEVADARPAALPLLGRLLLHGPVGMPGGDALPVPLGIRLRAAGLRPALAGLPDASRDMIVLAEPLLVGGGPQTSVETQRELRRVVGRGSVLQSLAVERSPIRAVRALLHAASLAHAWNAVFAVGDGAVLLSSAAVPEWMERTAAGTDGEFAGWPEDARWIAHAAHLGGLADLRRACLGTVGPAASESRIADEALSFGDGKTGRATFLAVCAEMLQTLPVEPGQSGSVLLQWSVQAAELRRTADAMRSLGTGPDAAAEAQAMAARFLHLGAPLPILQAALGLPTSDGVTLRDPASASLCAFAIDPTFFANVPPVLAQLPQPRQAIGALEDIAELPGPDRLTELCVGDAPLAVALRARFGSRCARALLRQLAAQRLTPTQAQALRELADPFVLAEASRLLRCRGSLPELLSLWRGDLPMPSALAELARGGATERRLLACALHGRRDPSVFGVLAEFLVAPEGELRELAGAALRAAVGDRVPYEPDWPRSALNEAADRVRSMHNRRP
ncbi:MAG: hypothetical protein ABIP94_04660, partial [Planctomycetota bacterium]